MTLQCREKLLWRLSSWYICQYFVGGKIRFICYMLRAKYSSVNWVLHCQKWIGTDLQKDLKHIFKTCTNAPSGNHLCPLKLALPNPNLLFCIIFETWSLWSSLSLLVGSHHSAIGWLCFGIACLLCLHLFFLHVLEDSDIIFTPNLLQFFSNYTINSVF